MSPLFSSPVVRRPHSLNIFSSESSGPVKVKFHMEPPWDGGTNPGHMTKMAAMPIYGKNLKRFHVIKIVEGRFYEVFLKTSEM